jgi:hypothetical protein
MYLNDWPYRTGEPTLEENVFYFLLSLTENIFRTTMPVAFWNVIFSKNNTATKLPCKNLGFQGIFIFQMNLLLYTGWMSSIKTLYIESKGNIVEVYKRGKEASGGRARQEAAGNLE